MSDGPTPARCPSCGGPLRSRGPCEYCGTDFWFTPDPLPIRDDRECRSRNLGEAVAGMGPGYQQQVSVLIDGHLLEALAQSSARVLARTRGRYTSGRREA